MHGGNSLLEPGNCNFGLTFAYQSESEEPICSSVIRMHCQHTSQFLNSLVVAAGMKQNPAGLNAADPKRVELTGTPGSGKRLVQAALAALVPR